MSRTTNPWLLDQEERCELACPGDGRAFDLACDTDPTVNAMIRHGCSLEETIVALVHEKSLLTQRIIKLESIAPRKIVLPDGRVMVWRCPDNLIPGDDSHETETNKANA